MLAGTSRAASAPITPTDKVVATQPPRIVSSLPQSSQTLDVDDSSKSSSIIQLSVDNASSDPETSNQSLSYEDVPESHTGNSQSNVDWLNEGKEAGWEWSWDSSIMVMSTNSKNIEGELSKILLICNYSFIVDFWEL